jgi:hypothetical protein
MAIVWCYLGASARLCDLSKVSRMTVHFGEGSNEEWRIVLVQQFKSFDRTKDDVVMMALAGIITRANEQREWLQSFGTTTSTAWHPLLFVEE